MCPAITASSAPPIHGSPWAVRVAPADPDMAVALEKYRTHGRPVSPGVATIW